jgi:oxalate decarboxylase/phosphoglucose isomerase-like protein (cupin superfamily)
VRINESGLFPSNTTTAAVLVEVNPGGMREPHRYPNGDEWLYVIEVQARLSVFIGQVRRVHSISEQATSVTFGSRRATTSRIQASFRFDLGTTLDR